MKKSGKRKRSRQDRLGALPDEILILIMSLLDTKCAVQACVLSKRWVNLWTLITSLNFNRLSFKTVDTFREFVNRVIARRRDDSININTFNYWSYDFFLNLGIIIDYALSHNVQHMTLCDKRVYVIDDADNPYSSRTLKTLTVKYPHPVHPIRVGCFESLLDLHLERALIDSTDPFSGFPNLVSLALISTLHRVDTDDLHLKISAPKLLKLHMSSCRFQSERHYNINNVRVFLLTPRLTSVKLVKGRVLLVNAATLLPCLDNVHIEMGDRHYSANKYDKNVALRLINLLRSLSNAKYVSLSMSAVEFLSLYPDVLASEASPFTNLKALNIVPTPFFKSFRMSRKVLNFLLENSPDLEAVVRFSDDRSGLECKDALLLYPSHLAPNEM